jgi:hypothetical protein
MNIESFVATLKSEGVDAGKAAAGEIEAQAHAQAAQIIATAKSEAEGIVAEASRDAENLKARMDSSLELATRDTLLLLQEKLSTLLRALLMQQVEQTLADQETLAGIMREVILASAQAPAKGKVKAEIHIPEETQSRLITGALRELTRALKNQDTQAEVKSSLSKAGFEYKIEGSTVEVSADSVTEMLAEMIDPELRHMLEQAVVTTG